jgi:hypothetical protein
MLLGEPRITSNELAEKFVSGVFKEMSRDGDQVISELSLSKWTGTVFRVLDQLGSSLGYDHRYPWRVDFIWWDTKSEELALAVESELSPSLRAIEEDFQKLTVFKCPVKLFIFKGDVEKTKRSAEHYLQKRCQHVKDEEYILIGFSSRPRCFFFRVPHDGRMQGQEIVQFSQLRLSSPFDGAPD